MNPCSRDDREGDTEDDLALRQPDEKAGWDITEDDDVLSVSGDAREG